MVATPPARRPRRCNRLVALTGLSLLCGCSQFESKWKAAALQESQAAPAAGIEGRWEGTWQSEGNSHSGGLRCIITRTSDATFHADYHATYWKLFQFGYSMPLTVTPPAAPDEETTSFAGDADLGWLAGGNYHYDGHATPADFYCTYRSARDHGTFKMTRPAGAPSTAHAAPTTAPASMPATRAAAE